MRFFGFLKDLLVPHKGNVYRPAIFNREWLALFLALTVAVEGFLIFNLFGRGAIQNFIAAVISSEIVELTNEERAHESAPALVQNRLLTEAAQAKAEDMAARSYFAHTGPDGKQPWAWIAESGYDYRFAGENLAVRFVDSSDVVRAWMESPTHRANIVKSAYEEIGIGIAQGTYKSAPATFVVQFFGTPREGAVAAAPSAASSVSQPPQTSAGIAAEVAGEETVAAEEASGPVSQPTLVESWLKTAIRAFAEPRAVTALALGIFAALLGAALALTFFVHIQVQPTDLLLKGAAVAFVPLFLILLNASAPALSPPENDQAAAAGSAWLTFSEVDVGEGGVSTERFFIPH